MSQKYPKHQTPLEETGFENFHRQPRTEPEGLDEAKTYTDVYNIPHEAPRRAKR